MRKRTIFVVLGIFLFSCATVPITGRKQLALVPNSQILPLSYSSYEQVLKESKLSTNQAEVNMVKKVGSNIEKAVEEYMAQNNMIDALKGYEWEFNLIDDKDVINAWCMPGGKVAFYTGIMPICQDEAGVAVVMGHEVAHAIANHGGERMSQGLVQQLGGLALSVALQDKPEQTQALFFTAYAVGTTYGVMLPYSRLHESEADKLGLIFMAMAGYDPYEAPEFWERMKAQSQGDQPPEWMSTHPSHQSRIDELNAYIPKAMKHYKKGQNNQDIKIQKFEKK
ncbi:MAG: M48 family metallopeptidase [Bacteroidales bacterium]|nr:M48 family metallopeptidase [Bacteroidales bacterium]